MSAEQAMTEQPTVAAGDIVDSTVMTGKTAAGVLAVAELWAWVRWPARREPQTIKIELLRVARRAGEPV